MFHYKLFHLQNKTTTNEVMTKCQANRQFYTILPKTMKAELRQVRKCSNQRKINSNTNHNEKITNNNTFGASFADSIKIQFIDLNKTVWTFIW